MADLDIPPGEQIDLIASATIRVGLFALVASAGILVPIWYDWQYKDSDSRVGTVYFISFPAAMLLAVRAARSIWIAFEGAPTARVRKLLLSTIATALAVTTLVFAFAATIL